MWIYRQLLRLCPPDVRRDYGAAIEDMFARRISDARTVGRWRLVQAWRREITSLVVFGISERNRRHRAARRKADRMDTLWQETRLAARRLVHTPGFSLATVLTLALAIGANASIFTVVKRVALDPLPYPDSDRIVMLQHRSPMAPGPLDSIPAGVYYHYLDRVRTLESIALYRREERTITGAGEPERVTAIVATPSLGTVLQVRPSRGRWFSDADGTPGAPAVAVLSHGLWMRRYGGRPEVVGETVTLSGRPTQIVGVMPRGFAFPSPETAIWIAQQLSRPDTVGPFNDAAIARRRAGVGDEDVRRELNAALKDLTNAYPGDRFAQAIVGNIGLTSTALNIKEFTVGPVSRTLWVLLGSVGLVLLVACANVANLFLVRSETRQREVAVRRALGAGRASIVRFFLTESALLSAAGGVAGLAIAHVAVRLLVLLGPANLPRLHEVGVDVTTLAFTAGISALVAVVFGAIPLLHRAPLAVTLHELGRGSSASRSRHRFRHLLMAGQVALALVLLVSSGLLIRSFQKLTAIDPGFDSTSTLTFRLGLPAGEYPTRAAATRTHGAIVDRLAAIPGVAAVSLSSCLPLSSYCDGIGLAVEGRPDVTADGRGGDTQAPIVGLRAIAWDHGRALGLRLRRGRDISRDDVERGAMVAVVNERLVDIYFPGEDPIGRRVSPAAIGLAFRQWLTIVGVVADTPTSALNEPERAPKLFMPMTVAGGGDIRAPVPSTSAMTYVVRSPLAAGDLLPSIRAVIHDVDGTLALSQVLTLQEILDRSTAPMAFTMSLLVIAAAVTLLLGVVGIYGVMSYIVSQRTGEIGVRLALGEAPGAIAAAIVRRGGLVTLIGLGVGLGAALAGGRLIQSLLYDVSPRDPVVLSGTTAVLLAVALLACWLPARRASKLSPLEALRPE
jgi:putative ABC transport system permease protein